jgi:hypothetical protein
MRKDDARKLDRATLEAQWPRGAGGTVVGLARHCLSRRRCIGRCGSQTAKRPLLKPRARHRTRLIREIFSRGLCGSSPRKKTASTQVFFIEFVKRSPVVDPPVSRRKQELLAIARSERRGCFIWLLRPGSQPRRPRVEASDPAAGRAVMGDHAQTTSRPTNAVPHVDNWRTPRAISCAAKPPSTAEPP